jgi:hypothetical protein
LFFRKLCGNHNEVCAPCRSLLHCRLRGRLAYRVLRRILKPL